MYVSPYNHLPGSHACMPYPLIREAPLAFYISNPPRVYNTPLSFYPPELVFKRDLTEAVDIWNLGSTVSRNDVETYHHGS